VACMHNIGSVGQKTAVKERKSPRPSSNNNESTAFEDFIGTHMIEGDTAREEKQRSSSNNNERATVEEGISADTIEDKNY